jgi:Mor family transcriptional regulator
MNYKERPVYYASESNKEWYAQRNREMFEDKMAGMSNMELINKYQITPARIKYLISKERAKHGRSNDVSVN